MSNFAIESFWKRHLSDLEKSFELGTVKGWSLIGERNPYFVQPPMSLREGYNDLSTKLWLVAAPGAVGKSTLAKEICAATNAIYVDLSASHTVADGTMLGNIVSFGAYEAWRDSKTTLVIDALDEANLRITQESYRDFVSHIIDISKNQQKPIILLGRSGIIEETWCHSVDFGVTPAIFDVDYFTQDLSVEFIDKSISEIISKSKDHSLESSFKRYRESYRNKASDYINHLYSICGVSDRKFCGYAPVLKAISVILAGTNNPQTLDTKQIGSTSNNNFLSDITQFILMRESQKLRDQLKFVPDAIRENLYKPEEQLILLLNKIIPAAPATLSIPTEMTSEMAEKYTNSVSSFLADHPFIDSLTSSASSAIFEASIISNALVFGNENQILSSERYINSALYKPNPFFAAFYLGSLSKSKKTQPPLDVIGAVFESIRAGSEPNFIVSLEVEQREHPDNKTCSVEISCENVVTEQKTNSSYFETSAYGTLKFGSNISNVFIEAPDIDISFGHGISVTFGPNVTINSKTISFNSTKVFVSNRNVHDTTVYLQAERLSHSQVNSFPIVDSSATLSVCWENSDSFPWTKHSYCAPEPDEKISDILAGFRRLIIAFRSNKQDSLARFTDKIESGRVTRNQNDLAIRNKLLKDGILSKNAILYKLDPNALGDVVGCGFMDIKTRRYSEKLINYLSNL